MLEITNIEKLEELKTSGAVFILFGGRQCNVCHALRPQLEAMLQLHYPDITTAYIDCEVSPDICAQHSVFTLPSVQFYIEGMKVTEFARSFSVEQLRQSMHRSYTMWHENRQALTDCIRQPCSGYTRSLPRRTRQQKQTKTKTPIH